MDDWDTFSMDIVLQQSLIGKDGTIPGTLGHTIKYHWKRRYTSTGWRSVTLIDRPEGARRGSSISRIENDEDGSPIRLYDKAGELIRLPSNPLSTSGLVPHPTPIPDAGTRGAANGGRSWVENFVLSADTRARRSEAIVREYGKSLGRLGALDRFVVTDAQSTREILVDPQWAAIVEENVIQGGSLVSHLAFSYQPTNTSLIKISSRTETLVSRERELRSVRATQYTNLRFERRR
jgi:hypothetical protein